MGTCVDIFAPGTGITSAYNTSDTAIVGMSNTSMSAAYVVGAAALYLWSDPGATPAQVSNALFQFFYEKRGRRPGRFTQPPALSQVFAPRVVPTPLTPSGTIFDTTPSYSWSKIAGATQYQYQLYRGSALVYTKTVLTGACGSGTNCVNTPTTVLPYAAYKQLEGARADRRELAKLQRRKSLHTDRIPTPLAPTGTIFDTTPTYTWMKIPGATQYQYTLYRGATVVGAQRTSWPAPVEPRQTVQAPLQPSCPAPPTPGKCAPCWAAPGAPSALPSLSHSQIVRHEPRQSANHNAHGNTHNHGHPDSHIRLYVDAHNHGYPDGHL